MGQLTSLKANSVQGGRGEACLEIFLEICCCRPFLGPNHPAPAQGGRDETATAEGVFWSTAEALRRPRCFVDAVGRQKKQRASVVSHREQSRKAAAAAVAAFELLQVVQPESFLSCITVSLFFLQTPERAPAVKLSVRSLGCQA